MAGGRYFTTTRRSGGHRVRTYFGSGLMGELGWTCQQIRALEREEAAAAFREDCRAWAEIEVLQRQLADGADRLVKAALILDGFHQHRGEWRRRRTGQP